MTGPNVIHVGGSLLQNATTCTRIVDPLIDALETQRTWIATSAPRTARHALHALAWDPCASRLDRVLGHYQGLLGEANTPTLEKRMKKTLQAALPEGENALHAWGDQAAAWTLQQHLDLLGIPVPTLDLRGTQAIPRHWAAIVPGHQTANNPTPPHGRPPRPRIGRDGQAVRLAVRLGASEVHFWKQGGGITLQTAPDTICPEIDALRLLRGIGRTGKPLQRDAIHLAVRHGIELVLEDPVGGHGATRVLPGTPCSLDSPWMEHAAAA